MRKRNILAMGLILAVSLLAIKAFIITPIIVSNPKPKEQIPKLRRQPITFEDAGGTIISYEELLGFIESNRVNLWFPSWVPKNYHLTAIWARKIHGRLDYPVIMVYSINGIKDYRVMEETLVIEVREPSPVPLEEYVEMWNWTPIYDVKGKLIGILKIDAYCTTCKSNETLPLAIVRYDGLEYWISFRDPATLNKIVQSMRPNKAIP